MYFKKKKKGTGKVAYIEAAGLWTIGFLRTDIG